jgi:hypothetical protein
MAVATRSETVGPLPGSRPSHGALSVPSAAISVHASGIAPVFLIVQLGYGQFKSVNKDLNPDINSVLGYRSGMQTRFDLGAAVKRCCLSHNHDTISWFLRRSGWGVFSGN